MRKLYLIVILTVAARAETHTMTMKQAVERGLSNNPEVTMAKLDELKATQGIRVAQDPFYPHAGVGTGMAYTNGMPLSIEGSAPAIVQAKVTESIFNKPLSYSVNQQRETARGTAFITAQKRDEIGYQIASLFLDADRATRMIDTARKQLDSLQKVADTVETRVEGGRELPLAAKQATHNLKVARVQLGNLEADRDMAERNLAIALGYGPADLVAPAATERALPALPENEAAATTAALAASPDIKRIQSAMLAKGLEMRATETRRLPQIDLVAQYALFGTYNGLDQYFAHYQPNNVELGVSIQVPLFTGASIKAALAPLDTDRQRMRIELKSAQDKVTMGIHQSYQNIMRAQTGGDLAKDDLDLAREALTVVLDQMTEGRATLAQVEQARVTENEKWITFYDARFTQERARLDLLRQTGQLLASIQ